MMPYSTAEEIEEERVEDLARAARIRDLSEDEMRKLYCSILGYREALHTAHIFQENVDNYLLMHPAILFDPEAYNFAARASEMLFDLYQRIGALEPDLVTRSAAARVTRNLSEESE